MKKTIFRPLRLALLVLLVNTAVAASGQTVMAATGESTDNFSYTIGEVVVGDDIGMWSIDKMLNTSVKQEFTKDAVEIHSLGVNGNIEVIVTPEAVESGANLSLYSVNGMLLKRERIVSERTIIETRQLGTGTPLILVVSVADKVITTVKLVNKK